MNVRDGLIGLVILGLIVGIFFLQGPMTVPRTNEEKKVPSVQRSHVGAEEGSTAPDLKLITLEGKEVSLPSDEDKPTFIVFWTTWCGYCRSELPVIQKLYDQYKERIQFLIVNVTAEDDEKKVREFITNKKYTFPVLLDIEGHGVRDYSVRGLPTLLILSSKGTIQVRKSGAVESVELEKLLKSSLEGS